MWMVMSRTPSNLLVEFLRVVYWGLFFSFAMLMIYRALLTVCSYNMLTTVLWSFLKNKKSSNTVGQNLSRNLDNWNKWLIENKLSLHMGKTELILFDTKRKLKKWEHYSIECFDQVIKASPHVNYLGLTIDQHLNSDQMALCIILSKKITRGLHFSLDRYIFAILKARILSMHKALVLCLFDCIVIRGFSILVVRFVESRPVRWCIVATIFCIASAGFNRTLK